MSKKTLNKDNLTALGAERLADLLLEVSTGSADIKRRLRLELSHNVGPTELARDVRKRLVSIRKSTSFVGWRKRKSLIKDLNTQVDMITEKIAPEAPTEALDLLWQFIELAPSVYERVDDSRGDVGDVFRAAVLRFEDIGPRAVLDPMALASRVWDALRDNGYGEFDGIIGLLAPTLGEDGLQALKDLVEAYREMPAEASQDDHEALRFLRDLRGDSGNYVSDQKDRLIKMCLQEIAEAQGDTDAYIAQYSAHDLARPDIAAEVAQLLLSQGEAKEALKTLTEADLCGRAFGQKDWDVAYIACLIALDRIDEVQSYRWERFSKTLNPDLLRDYLKVLPDFDDIEAEDKAKALALDFENLHLALIFFLDWPDLTCAARLIESRSEELDGDLYHILTPGAEALREKHPLAAVLLWRAMIDHALTEGRSTRYGHAADHLMDCAAVDDMISDYGAFASHLSYLEDLRTRHDRKTSFWQRVH
ncbi:DUF6880 family protein [uncultured Roseobacter sp.]|uniref:DUF6880 family protein n=1 Tax=uncultured Roseobacter sp. TaxID=114847 RepID=UPI002606AF54|nr:DUF6880 family protein [uncultured Roseobacter sp.]